LGYLVQPADSFQYLLAPRALFLHGVTDIFFLVGHGFNPAVYGLKLFEHIVGGLIDF
jgi:hypothetical protein